MDYELIFWVCAAVVIPIILIGFVAYRIRSNERAEEWRREHADDFNKDLWEDWP